MSSENNHPAVPFEIAAGEVTVRHGENATDQREDIAASREAQARGSTSEVGLPVWDHWAAPNPAKG